MRLDKRVALNGYSRAQARALIAAGRAAVGGLVSRDPARKVADEERVTLDGCAIEGAHDTHLMLNKPAGVVTAKVDGHFRTVFDLLPEKYAKADLSAVGRLDKDVTGLLILTSSGELAHRLISPKRNVVKRYRAEVEGRLTKEHAEMFLHGVDLGDFTAKPAKLFILASGDFSLAELDVTEGKFHQVKRMFQAVGCPVKTLSRLSVGGVRLDERLMPGESRPLTEEEVARLYRAAGWEDRE